MEIILTNSSETLINSKIKFKSKKMKNVRIESTIDIKYPTK